MNSLVLHLKNEGLTEAPRRIQLQLLLEATGCRVGLSSQAADSFSTSSSESLAPEGELFAKIDSDGDGELSRQELQVPQSTCERTEHG